MRGQRFDRLSAPLAETMHIGRDYRHNLLINLLYLIMLARYNRAGIVCELRC